MTNYYGYIDQNIIIENDTFYEYQTPALTTGKGNLVKLNLNNPNEFDTYVKKANKKSKVIWAIFIIILLAFLLMFGN